MWMLRSGSVVSVFVCVSMWWMVANYVMGLCVGVWSVIDNLDYVYRCVKGCIY